MKATNRDSIVQHQEQQERLHDEEYESWTNDDLYEKAKELRIEGRATMTRDQLIEALRNR